MIYIGIDYSISSPAVCIIENDKLSFCGYDSRKTVQHLKDIKFSESNFDVHIKILRYPHEYMSSYDRYHKVASGIFNFIKEKVDQDDEYIIFIEDYNPNPNKNRNNIIDMAEATCWFKQMLFNAEYNFYPANIASVKKEIAGNGNATKDMICEIYMDKIGIDFTKHYDRRLIDHPFEDFIDAWSIAKYGESQIITD